MISGKYKEFYDKLEGIIPVQRMHHDPLNTLAFGTDASFYRLIPKLVIKAHSEEEIVAILTTAYNMRLPVTFRAAGTSLSGQAISDSILVLATHGWKEHKILDHGLKICLQPGIRGAAANRYLAPYGRKIGPDPASIDAAMIGGIAANNASGMCCGVADNSYKTVADIRIILPDGTLLDTADEASVRSFKESHKELLSSLERISSDIRSNTELKERIIRKYKIKNTNGYSLNAFTDYSEGIDILKHLIIGSEGTLAFISSITYNTVIEHPHKALAMVVFTSIKDACTAAHILKEKKATAVELIDRTGVRSADQTPGIPEYLKTIGEESCVLLIEARGASAEELKANVESLRASISHLPTELPYTFTTDAKEQAMLWKIRKELFPTVAGLRKSGTTPIIEDICFPIEKLAEATVKLREIFERNGYADAVIFGHAMDGNLHFVFNQNFSKDEEVEKYRIFMNDITDMVVSQYDGSLKAEHGTGRNMAPFMEKEWGQEAYSLMKEVKEIFDPKGILNPGVIIDSDPKAHISNLKPIPTTREVVDKCMECGFCEGHCVSEGLTLSPRQRVAVFREMEHLKRTGEEPHRAAEMQKLFRYSGEQTCATDSLCHLNCPVKADTGKLIKEIRHETHSPKGEKRAVMLAGNMDKLTSLLRGGLKLLHGIRLIFGKKLFGALARGVRAITFKLIPLWNEHMPTGASKIKRRTFPEKELKVVYFPSCITRSMGTSQSYSKEKEITRMTEALLTAAGYQIIYPENMNNLCCGMLFSSKGYVEAGKKASDELKAALIKASENGKYPVLCDMSPCLYTMRTNMEGELKLYEPAEFIDKYLLDRLKLKPVDEKVAIFAVCSAKQMEVESNLENVARRCAREVVIVDSNCCGFAGDRGFFFPELNQHGLRDLEKQSEGCSHGYATSRTCEIGLSRHSGIEFKSIIYLAAQAAGIDTSK